MNKVIMIGNLGADPEVKHLESGATVAKFRLATNKQYLDRNGEKVKETQWHQCVAWRKTAELVEKFIKKGDRLAIEGELTHRKWQDKDGNDRWSTEVVVDRLHFQGGSNREEGGKSSGSQEGRSGFQEPVKADTIQKKESFEDLPF